jgi:hypothetical protein
MVNESAKRAVARELRQLRKIPGPLGAAKITHAPVILKGFGGGDAEVAFVRLIDLGAEHPGDRDIEATMASMGAGVHSESVLDRLNEYGERHFVDARTVRRWSDTGILKLTLLILGSAPWVQPRIRQVLVVEDEFLKIGIDVRIPANLRMNVPLLWLDGKEVEIRMPEIVVSSEPQHLRTGLDVLIARTDLPATVRLQWVGEKYPIYESVTRGTLDVYFTSRIVFLEMKTTISSWRKIVTSEP